MAETYGIYDYESHSPRLIATLAAGLRENSRLRMELAESKISNETWLLASAVDRLSILVWQNTEGGRTGQNKPTLFTDLMLGTKEKDIVAFDTPEEFEKERQRILGGKS